MRIATAVSATAVIATIVVAAAALLGGCSPPPAPLRLRHEAGRTLLYRLVQREDAPHPVLGLGGVVEGGADLGVACLEVDPSGVATAEISVRGVRLTAPASAGIAVDTARKGPVPGDRTGATPVALSLLPRTGVVRIAPTGLVSAVTPDAAVAAHLAAWSRTQPPAAQGAIHRFAELLDPPSLVRRWFHPLASTLPSVAVPPAGASWASSPPPVETPAGRLRATLDVAWERESGSTAVLRGRGSYALDGDAPASRALDFVSGTVETTLVLDVVRGVVVSFEEKGSFEFAARAEPRTPTPWTYLRQLRLVE